jgi:hypothetical protein
MTAINILAKQQVHATQRNPGFEKVSIMKRRLWREGDRYHNYLISRDRAHRAEMAVATGLFINELFSNCISLFSCQQ